MLTLHLQPLRIQSDDQAAGHHGTSSKQRRQSPKSGKTDPHHIVEEVRNERFVG